MLKLLRNESHKKKIFLGMAILILPSFLIFGVVAENNSNNMDAVAGLIGKSKISTGEFIRQYQSARRELFLLRGIDPRSAGEIDFEKITWDRVLLLEYARKNGVRTSNSEVLEWIGRQEAFSPGGTFSEPLYKIYVERQLRLTPRQFEEEIREFLTVQKSVEKIAPAKEVSEDEAKQIFLERFSPRDLRYVVVQALPEATTVTDEEVKKLYDAIGKVLEIPETRKARYVMIEKGSAQDKSETKEAIVNGFAAAQTLGLATKETGFLKRSDVFPGAAAGSSELLMQQLFRLNAGERSGVLDAGGTWMILELAETVEKRPMTYDEAKADLRARLSDSEKNRASYDRALSVRQKMDGQGFAETAAAEKLEILEVKGFKRPDALAKAGVLMDYDSSLATLKAGQISSPMMTSGGYVIAEVLSVREELGEDWEKQKESIRKEFGEKGREETYSTEMAKLWSKLTPNQETMTALFPDKYKENPATAEPPAAPEEPAS